jgi:hypothetical protein
VIVHMRFILNLELAFPTRQFDYFSHWDFQQKQATNTLMGSSGGATSMPSPGGRHTCRWQRNPHPYGAPSLESSVGHGWSCVVRFSSREMKNSVVTWSAGLGLFFTLSLRPL